MFVLSPVLAPVIVCVLPLFAWVAIRFRDRSFPASWNDQRSRARSPASSTRRSPACASSRRSPRSERELDRLIDRAPRAVPVAACARPASTPATPPTLQALPMLGPARRARPRRLAGASTATSRSACSSRSPATSCSSSRRSACSPACWRRRQQARAGAERVFELLDLRAAASPTRPTPGRSSTRAAPSSSTTSAFGYTPAARRRCTTSRSTVRPGERIGLVGASGSGKSTLALLHRPLLRPDDRHRAPRRRRRARLHARLAAPRRSTSCSRRASCSRRRSARTSPSAGPDATDAEIEAAAPRSPRPTSSSASCPHGYDTVVGERGLHPVGRPAPAHRPGPGGARRPAGARARRRHVGDRRPHRGGDPRLARRRARRRARRSSSPTARRRCASPTASSCSTAAASSPRAPTPSCWHTSDALPRAAHRPRARAAPSSGPPSSTTIDPAAWPPRRARDGARRTERPGDASTRPDGRRGSGGGAPIGGDRRPRRARRRHARAARRGRRACRRCAATPTSTSPTATADGRTVQPAPPGPAPFRWPLAARSARSCRRRRHDARRPAADPPRHRRRRRRRRRRSRCAAMCVAFLGRAARQLGQRRSAMLLQTSRTAERMLFSLRVRTFAHLQRLSLDYYDNEMGGRIMTRMTTDVEALAQLLQQGLLIALVERRSACVGRRGRPARARRPRWPSPSLVVLPLLAVVTVWFQRGVARAPTLRARDAISTRQRRDAGEPRRRARHASRSASSRQQRPRFARPLDAVPRRPPALDRS